MKKRRVIIIVISAVLFVFLLCAAVILLLSEYVFVAGRLIPRNTVSVDLSGESIDTSEILKFRSPEYLNLENCGISTDEYDLIREAFPDCDIKWSVPLSSGLVSNKCAELTLSSLIETDLPLFAYFDDLKIVHAEGIDEWELLSTVEKQYPDIDFSWEVCLNGKYYSLETIELILDEPICFSDLHNKLAAFMGLKSVSLQNDDLTTDEKLSLQESYPDVSFFSRWRSSESCSETQLKD